MEKPKSQEEEKKKEKKKRQKVERKRSGILIGSGTKFEIVRHLPIVQQAYVDWLLCLKWITSSLVVNGVMCFDLEITHMVFTERFCWKNPSTRSHRWLRISRVFRLKACAAELITWQFFLFSQCSFLCCIWCLFPCQL